MSVPDGSADHDSPTRQLEARVRELEASLEARVLERTATLRGLHRFVRELNSLEDINGIARHVVASGTEILDSLRVSLLVPGADGRSLVIAAARGLPERVAIGTQIDIGAGVAGRVFSTREDVIVNAASELPADLIGFDGNPLDAVPMACACLVAPSGAAVGVLNVSRPRSASQYDEVALGNAHAIAEAAAIAIENQNHRGQRDKARDAVILAVARLAEDRDPDTGSHVQRLQEYCRLLARAMMDLEGSGVDAEFVDALVRAAPLHDIGKLGIPDAILKKPGGLDDAERDLMRRHAEIGARVLLPLLREAGADQFLQFGADVAWCHHERWDGNGYPRGLAGTEIPLSARILALADVYDALTTRRVYKEPLPHGEVYERLVAASGSHFDPGVVAAFERVAREFETTAQHLADAVRRPTRVDDVEWDPR